MSTPHAALAQAIADNGGPLSFEQFMKTALYHPERGYYSRHVGIGKSGDFSTTSTLSPVLAEALASWIRSRQIELFAGQDCNVIELGPGNGILMSAIIQALCHDETDTGAYHFYTVETSPVLREELKTKCVERIHIFDTLTQALEACNGEALIYSNEFPDAFPAVQLCYCNGDWQEVCVDTQDDVATEVFIPLSRGIDADAPNRVRENQRLFIHPSYHQYLCDALPSLAKGAMLTIDYGRAYPSGECRAYGKHQRYEGMDVYAQMGERDITCDVNFTDLKRWGEQLGLSTTAFETQADFLSRHLPNLKERAESDEAVAFLTNPLGAGGAFMCLEQQGHKA